MSVQVPASKTVSFKLPFIGKTFQQLAEKLLGRDGYISGAETSDDAVHVSIGPVVFSQRGILCETSTTNSTLAVPTTSEPWFVLAATPDDHPDSQVLLSVTSDPGAAANAVVIAFKANGRWQNPPGVDIAAAAARSSELGIDKDARIEAALTGANLSAIRVYKGQIVDPDGERRLIPRSTESALAASLTPTRPHPTLHRSDYAVLRQIEGYSPEIVHLQGPAMAADTTITPVVLDTVTAPAKKAGFYAKRGGSIGEQWWAWGDNTALFTQGGPAAEGYAAVGLLVGAGAIKESWIAGQRAADDAIILLYLDGQDLKLVSFDPTDGSLVDAAIKIADTGAQISHVRAVLDATERLHITFENDEAKQQVYYMTCSIAAVSFGTIGKAPTYLDLVTTTNDTWPSIGVSRLGVVTIAYIQGTGANEYGSLAVATLDTNGALVSRVVATPVDDIATAAFPDSTDEQDLLSTGFTATVFDRLRRAAVVVTPQDDVYVFVLGSVSGVDYEWALAYNAEFQARHGWAVLSILPEATSGSINGIAAAAGELGQIAVLFKTVVPVNTSFVAMTVLQPRPFENGRNGSAECVFLIVPADNRVETSGYDDIGVSRGPSGGWVANYVLGLDTVTAEIFGTEGKEVRPHPKDLYLGNWIVPADAGATIDATARDFGVFNTRPKRMNFPILVGDGGDYQGYTGLYAAAAASKVLGGDVIIRPGTYHLNEFGLQFLANVRGEGRVVLVATGDSFVLGQGGSGGAVAIAGNIVSSADLGNVRPGGILKLATSGFHTVVRNLGYGAGVYKLLVADNDVGPPVGATAIRYWPGIGLENITIVGAPAAGICDVLFENAYQGVLRNVRLEGKLKITLVGAYQSLIDNLDVRQIDNTDADVSIECVGGNENTYRALKLADGHGTCHIDNTEQNPHFIACHSDGVDSTKLIYDIEAGRTTSCLFSSCTGKVTGNALSYINAMAYVNNTSGPTRSLMQMVADPLQTAAMAQFFGRWGTSTIIDSIGELGVTGERLHDDFLSLDEDLWELRMVGNGIVFAPGKLDEVRYLPGGSFAEGDVDGNAVFDAEASAWAIGVDENSLSASLEGLKPGDRISSFKFTFTPANSDLDFTFSFMRRNLTTGVAAEVVETTTVTIPTGAAFHVETWNLATGKIEDGYAYWVEVFTDNPAAFPDCVFQGCKVTSKRQGATRTEHSTNNIRLEINPFNATDSVAQLATRHPVNTWDRAPLMRMRMAIGNLTDANLLHVFGLFAEGDDFGTAFFVHDPGNVLGLGASNQIRFVVRDDAGVYTSALTGITPGAAPTYLYYWIGYKALDEVYWGISSTLIGAMSAQGSVATNPLNTVRLDNNKILAAVSNTAAGGAVSTALYVDTILHRTDTKFV